MAVFPSFKLTKKGEELLNRSIGEGKVLTFTKFEIGDGNPPSDFREQTSLVNKFYQFPVLSTDIQKNQILRIKGYFDNKSFTGDKQLKEIGVFVKIQNDETEYLYSYTNAGESGDIIPGNTRGFYSRTLDVANYIGYATNITFNIEQLRDRYAFNTENEMKVATYLKVGDKVELWGNLVLGDKPVDGYIVQAESADIELNNGLFAKKVIFNYVVKSIEELKKLYLKENDIVELLGEVYAGDGKQRKVIFSDVAGLNAIKVKNGYFNEVPNSRGELKNDLIRKVVINIDNNEGGLPYGDGKMIDNNSTLSISLKNVKGEKGDKPIRGVDYMTKEEKESFTQEMITNVQQEGEKVINKVSEIVSSNPGTSNALALSGKTRPEFEKDTENIMDKISYTSLYNNVDISENDTKGSYINFQGKVYSDDDYNISKKIHINKNQTLVVKGKGYQQNVAMISEYVDGKYYKPLVVSVDSSIREYTYTSDRSKDVVVCYENKNSVNVSLYNKLDIINNELNSCAGIISENIIYNLFANSNDYTLGKYINFKGTVSNANEDSPLWCYTKPFLLEEGCTLVVKGKGYQQNVAMISEYIDGVTYNPLVISIDSTVREYLYKANKDTHIVVCLNLDSDKREFYYNKKGLKNHYEELSSKEVREDFSNSLNYISGKYINLNGGISSSNGWCYTKPFLLEEGCMITVKGKGYQQNVAMISEYIDGVTYNPLVLSIDSTVREYTYKATKNMYISVSLDLQQEKEYRYTKNGLQGKVDYLYSKQISEENIDKMDYTKIFNHMVGIGDSLMSGEIIDTTTPPKKVIDAYDYSWLAHLSKFNNASYKCVSKGGLKAKTWLEGEFKTEFENLKVIPDCVFIALGTNDKNESSLPLGEPTDLVDANTFCGYYNEIIKIVHAKSPYAKVFLCSLYNKRDKDKQYSEKIRKISNRYPYCYYLDILSNSTISPSDNGINAEDWHFSTIGYMKIAEVVHRILNTSVKENIQDYKYHGLYNSEYYK